MLRFTYATFIDAIIALYYYATFTRCHVVISAKHYCFSLFRAWFHDMLFSLPAFDYYAACCWYFTSIDRHFSILFHRQILRFIVACAHYLLLILLRFMPLLFDSCHTSFSRAIIFTCRCFSLHVFIIVFCCFTIYAELFCFSLFSCLLAVTFWFSSRYAWCSIDISLLMPFRSRYSPYFDYYFSPRWCLLPFFHAYFHYYLILLFLLMFWGACWLFYFARLFFQFFADIAARYLTLYDTMMLELFRWCHLLLSIFFFQRHALLYRCCRLRCRHMPLFW